MDELRILFKDSPQEIIGERLYYYVTEEDYTTLHTMAERDPVIRAALEETVPLEGQPGFSHMIPVERVQEAAREG